jgi:hypothetical protein
MTSNGETGNDAESRRDGVSPSNPLPSATNQKPRRATQRQTIPSPNQDGTPTILPISIDRWIELAFTATIMIATIVNVCIANWQWSTMVQNNRIASGQLEAMEIDKRPWIRANVELKELRLTEWANDKHIFTSLTFDLKNYGESPAINIVIFTNVGPHPGNSERPKLDADQKVMCEQARANATANPIGGPTIFPTESNPIQSGAGSGGIYKTGEPTIFSVNGCIDYSYGKDRHGETGFRMILGKVANNRIVGIPFIEGKPETILVTPKLFKQGFPIDSKVAIVPPDNLLFRPDEGGNYAK